MAVTKTSSKSKTQSPSKSSGQTFVSHFVGQDENPYDQVKWAQRSSKISSADGKEVFAMNAVEVPESWSQLATDIAVSKYFRKAGVPGIGHETSVRQLVHRVAHTIRNAGEDLGGYFASEEDAEQFEKELTHLLLQQKGAFNSPVWFNTGLFHKYGINGSAGNFRWDSSLNAAVETDNAYEHPQASACFIQSVEDDLMSIFNLAKNEARIFKYGSGTGTNFSKIRGAMEKLSGGGLSSGLMSFLEVLDRGAGATKSGGTTRRAAKMVSLDMDHPEIREFINWKVNEEKKVAALVEAGYSSDFNGDAYKTVAGQNSNNSVRVPDEFMSAVERDGEWQTTARTDGSVIDTFKARELWDDVAQAAWSCADPGVQFDSTIQKWHTCSATGPIRGSNPCSEFMFLDDTACNLASLNLTKFLREDGTFDTESYRYACRVFFTAQEILVDFSSYPTDQIATNSHNFRPLGLGYANLGTLLMVKGIAYDSEEGFAWAGALTAIMHGEAFRTSSLMAQSKGAFAGYQENAEVMTNVMKQHLKALDTIDRDALEKTGGKGLLEEAYAIWDETIDLGTKHGYRNSQATVLAPTGTIGLLMDCDTTGIEPDFALVKFKKLAGGGHFKIVNQSVPRALKTLGYTDKQIPEIIAYVSEHMTIEGAPHLKAKHLPVFDCANKCGENGERYLAPMAHIRMMAAAQPFISGAISKTVNVPNEAKVEDIKKIYEQGWKLGLKAVAVYRDGSKLSQPLSGKAHKKDSAQVKTNHIGEPLQYSQKDLEEAVASAIGLAPARKRKLPQKRRGLTIEATVGGQKIFLRTGEYDDGRIGEIFIDMHKEGATLRSLLNCFAISVSMGLQYGVPLEDYVDKFTFTRFEPAGLVDHPNIKTATSILDFVFRVLGMEYLGKTDFVHVKPAAEDLAIHRYDEVNQMHLSVEKASLPEKANEHIKEMDAQLSRLMGDAPMCSTCGHVTVRNGSCYRCLNCGNSMGCS